MKTILLLLTWSYALLIASTEAGKLGTSYHQHPHHQSAHTSCNHVELPLSQAHLHQHLQKDRVHPNNNNQLSIASSTSSSSNVPTTLSVLRDLQETSTWTKLGADVTGAAVNDLAGGAVSMSADGTRMAVAASQSDSGGTDAGQVRVWEYASNNQWALLGPEIRGESAGEFVGASVALSGDGTTLVIGSTNEFPYMGFVRIYRYNAASKVWTKLGADIVGHSDRDRFGASVAISYDGSKIAVGAPFHDGDDTIRGHVRVFEYGGTSWTKIGRDLDGAEEGDKAGLAVAMNKDGTVVAVGAPTANGSGLSNSGTVRVYERTSTLNDWTMMGNLIPGTVASEQSGYSVALSDDGMVVAIGR